MRTIAWPRLNGASSERVGLEALDFRDCVDGGVRLQTDLVLCDAGRGGGEEILDAQIIAREYRDDAPAIEHECSMADLRDLFEIRRHDENRGAAAQRDVEQ